MVNKLLLHVVLVFYLSSIGDAATISPVTTEPPQLSIESLRRNWGFRSGGTDVTVVFSRGGDSPVNFRRGQQIKLILQYVQISQSNSTKTVSHSFEFYESAYNDEEIFEERENSTTIRPASLTKMKQLSIETDCQFNGDRNREAYCPLPNVAQLFPNFTADLVERDDVIAAQPMQPGDICNRTTTGLCYAIKIDGVHVPMRRQRRIGSNRDREASGLVRERHRTGLIFYYPDPVITSATLTVPAFIMSIAGIGLTSPMILTSPNIVLPDFSIFVTLRTNSVQTFETVPVNCNVTYKRESDDGFNCIFEVEQIPALMKPEPVLITVRYGNWSSSKELTFERKRIPFPAFTPQPFPPFFHEDGGRGPPRRIGDDRMPPPNRNDPRPPHMREVDDQRGRNPRDRNDESWLNLTEGNKPRGKPPFIPPMRPEMVLEIVNSNSSLATHNAEHATLIVKIVAPISAVSFFIIACVTLFCCLRRTRLRSTKLFMFLFPAPKPIPSKIPSPEPQRFSLELLPEDTLATLARHRIDKARLIVGNELGEGHFGVVRSAIIYPPRYRNQLAATLSNPEHMRANRPSEGLPQKVAIKTIQRYQNLERMKEFFEEAIVMFSFNHPNVLSAIGYADDVEGFPAIILPLMDAGNLHTFVRTNPEFSNVMLYDFARQISKGMAYLAEKKLIHRDLAARNCLLNKKMIVKVSDFGLSRTSASTNYDYGTPQYEMMSHHRPLPIRWLAPECFEDGVFTEKSDVWSFGVLLWELATRGQRPYGDLESSKVVSFVRLERGRLPQTFEMSPEIYGLMQKCWNEHSSERPSFVELVELTKALIDLESQDDYCDPHLSVAASASVPTIWMAKRLALEKTSSLDSQALSLHSLVTNVTSLPISLTDPTQLSDDTGCYIEVLGDSSSGSSRSSLENDKET